MPRTSQKYRYITRLSKVRGGHPRIEGTRIGVHDVVGLLQNGESVDSIISNCFPDITKAQVYECLAYYEDHRGEIDLLIAREMAPGGMKFLLDHDVPIDISYSLFELGHEVVRLPEVLDPSARDEQVLEYASRHGCALISCNCDDFLQLAQRTPHCGLIILVRRKNRAAGEGCVDSTD
jgi:uncharacterized protein (DUF433 family)/predicted nuclease of predicted toxin-antitoxin system